MSTKITNVEKQESTYQGKKKTSYKFTLSDGKVGFASNKAPWEFKEGDDVTYTNEVKTSSKGEYNLFTFTKVAGSTPAPSQEQASQPSFHAPKTTNVAQMKFDARIKCLELAVGGLFSGKLEEGNVKEFITSYSSFMDGLIDEIFTA